MWKKNVQAYSPVEATTKIWNKSVCQMDGRMDETTDKFRFHELCWHSQAELKDVRAPDSQDKIHINYPDWLELRTLN